MVASVWGRVKRLAVPALALAGTWVVLGVLAGNAFDVEWVKRGVILVISPLWFIAAYLVIIALFPVFLLALIATTPWCWCGWLGSHGWLM